MLEEEYEERDLTGQMKVRDIVVAGTRNRRSGTSSAPEAGVGGPPSPACPAGPTWAVAVVGREGFGGCTVGGRNWVARRGV